MKPTVYIETTIVSYLTTPRKKSPVAEDIAATHEWWDQSRSKFDLVTSEVVLLEAAQGNPEAAAARLKLLATINELPANEAAKALTKALLSKGALPKKAQADAAHAAIAAVNGIDYLLTWNCRHLANATLRAKIEQVCRDHGYEPPIICTPKQLTEVES